MHGSVSEYRRGCRCDACKRAKRIAAQEYHVRNRGAELERMAAYRSVNRSRVNEERRRDYAANPEKFREACRQWRSENADRVSQMNRRYRERNPGVNNEATRKWRAENPDYQKAYYRRYVSTARGREVTRESNRRRVSRKRGANHGCVNAEQILDLWTVSGGVCAYCEGQGEHVDHIHPLARGGLHCIGNLTVACANCNHSKGARILDNPPSAPIACSL